MLEKKKILIIFILTFFLAGFCGNLVLAQEKDLDYGSGLVLDSDLDGLTDLGEEQIFKTDRQDPDTDGDGFLDGAEVLAETDPLDASVPRTKETITYSYPEDEDALWSWYLARAGGLISFLLLYLSFFFGVAMFIPLFQRILRPVYSYELHSAISYQAFFFVMIHALVLLFDKYLKFSPKDIFVPMASSFNPELITLGVLGMYVMLAIVLAGIFRKYLSRKVWGIIHGLNIGLYVVAFFHALYLGTDLKNPISRDVFFGMNVVLVVLIFWYGAIKLGRFLKNRKSLEEAV